MRIQKFLLLNFVIGVLVLCTGCHPNNAAEAHYQDCHYIPAEHQSLIEDFLRAEEVAYDGILRIYSNSYYSVALGDTIEENLGITNSRGMYMAYCMLDGQYEVAIFVRVRDGEAHANGDWLNFVYNSWNDLLPCALEPEQIFGEEVKVKAVYWLQSDYNYEGATLCFITDQGDFFLHQNKNVHEGTYLVPYDVVKQRVEEDQAELAAMGGGLAGSLDIISGEPDMEQYIIDLENPPEFPLP